MSERKLTPKFMLAFPKIFKPNKKDKYEITMVFQKGTDIKELQELVKAAAIETHGKFDKTIGHPFKTHTDEEKLEKYPFFKDAVVVRAETGFAIDTVVDAKRNPILDWKELYTGCFARASVSAYAWTYEEGGIKKKGVKLNLHGIQKISDGERYGSQPGDEFSVLETEDDIDLYANNSTDGEDDSIF